MSVIAARPPSTTRPPARPKAGPKPAVWLGAESTTKPVATGPATTSVRPGDFRRVVRHSGEELAILCQGARIAGAVTDAVMDPLRPGAGCRVPARASRPRPGCPPVMCQAPHPRPCQYRRRGRSPLATSCRSRSAARTASSKSEGVYRSYWASRPAPWPTPSIGPWPVTRPGCAPYAPATRPARRRHGRRATGRSRRRATPRGAQPAHPERRRPGAADRPRRRHAGRRRPP